MPKSQDSGFVTASTYYGDGSNLTSLPTQDPFPYTGDAIITGSNSLAGNYALKVAKHLVLISITAENDGNVELTIIKFSLMVLIRYFKSLCPKCKLKVNNVANSR